MEYTKCVGIVRIRALQIWFSSADVTGANVPSVLLNLFANNNVFFIYDLGQFIFHVEKRR